MLPSELRQSFLSIAVFFFLSNSCQISSTSQCHYKIKYWFRVLKLPLKCLFPIHFLNVHLICMQEYINNYFFHFIVWELFFSGSVKSSCYLIILILRYPYLIIHFPYF